MLGSSLSLTRRQLEDVHEGAAVHAHAAGDAHWHIGILSQHMQLIVIIVTVTITVITSALAVQELVLVLRRMAAENKIDLDLPNIHLKP